MDAIQWIVYSAFILVALGMFVFATRAKKKSKQTAPQADERTSGDRLQLSPPESAPSRPLSSREKRDADILTRFRTGMCMYCERTATHGRPRICLLTSKLDVVYRYFGVVPRDRYKIEVSNATAMHALLCETHHNAARSRLEHKLAESSLIYASFVVEERDMLVNFERYELDEAMLSQAESTRLGRPKIAVSVPLRSIGGGSS